MAEGADPRPTPAPVAFRLPRTAYLVVLFLFFGAMPLAFTSASFSFNSQGDSQGAPAVLGWQTFILLVPLASGFFVWRTATFVDRTGVRVRALFGARMLPWADVRGLSVTGRGVYAVIPDGSVRLPCVGVQHLGAISRASGGRLPELADARPKSAPQRRRR